MRAPAVASASRSPKQVSGRAPGRGGRARVFGTAATARAGIRRPFPIRATQGQSRPRMVPLARKNDLLPARATGRWSMPRSRQCRCREPPPRRKVRGKFLHEWRPRPAARIRPSPSAAAACAASPCAGGARPARPSRVCAGARIRPRSPRRARPIMGAHHRADPPTSGEEGRPGAGASGMRGNGRGRGSLEREGRAASVKGLGLRA